MRKAKCLGGQLFYFAVFTTGSTVGLFSTFTCNFSFTFKVHASFNVSQEGC